MLLLRQLEDGRPAATQLEARSDLARAEADRGLGNTGQDQVQRGSAEDLAAERSCDACYETSLPDANRPVIPRLSKITTVLAKLRETRRVNRGEKM